MRPLKSEIAKELENADWAQLGKEMLAFAAWRAQNYHWRSGAGDQLASGTTLEDLVSSVVTKTLRGQRKWDPSVALSYRG